jgi:folylpolyglutamate synthase/dihydropteroate synthase
LLIAVEIAGFARSRSAEEIKKIAKDCGINSTTAKNFDEAFAKISKNVKAAEGALALVCGSLYLAGKFIEENI